MATVSEDLEAFRELALHEQIRLNALPDPDDELEQLFAVSELDELCPEYLGRLSLLISSPNLLVLDERREFLAIGNMDATGIFLGAQVVKFDDDKSTLCILLVKPEVDVVGYITGDPEGAYFVVGRVDSTDFWPDEDIFNSGVDLKGVAETDLFSEASAVDLAGLEEEIDIALLNPQIDLAELVRLFENPDIIPDGMVLKYYVDRVNRILNPQSLTWDITTNRLFVYDRTTNSYISKIDYADEVSLRFKGRVLINVGAYDKGKRVLYLEYSVEDPETNSSDTMMVPIGSISELSLSS